MTREEAAKILNEIWPLTERQAEAMDVAIEVLKQTKKTKDDKGKDKKAKGEER